MDLAPRRKGYSVTKDRQSMREGAWDRAWKSAQRVHQCTSPITLSTIGLPSGITDPEKSPIIGDTIVSCRKCTECLLHRRRIWTARAVDEINASHRTWFGTLTFSPEERFRIRMQADAYRSRRGWEPFSAMHPDEQFRALSEQAGQDVTKFLKRVRKICAGPLRYLLVSEAHKDGFPHYHLLLHEGRSPVRKASLEAQWRSGFSHWRLVERDTRAAVYTCKYLSKDCRTRVRSSQKYGQATLVASATERLHEALAAIRKTDGRQFPTV